MVRYVLIYWYISPPKIDGHSTLGKPSFMGLFRKCTCGQDHLLVVVSSSVSRMPVLERVTKLMVKPRNTQSAMAHNEEINWAVKKSMGWNPTLLWGFWYCAWNGNPVLKQTTFLRNVGLRCFCCGSIRDHKYGAMFPPRIIFGVEYFEVTEIHTLDTVNWSKNLDIHIRERSQLPLGLETSKNATLSKQT